MPYETSPPQARGRQGNPARPGPGRGCERRGHRRAAPVGIGEGQDAGMMTLRKIDPDVQKLLETYRMPTTVFA